MYAMKARSLPPAAVLLGCLLHTTMATASDGVVGTATLELDNKARGRKVITELWFTAAAEARIEWFSPRAPLRPIPIARNANPPPPLHKRALTRVSQRV
jgi:hypothetical protein